MRERSSSLSVLVAGKRAGAFTVLVTPAGLLVRPKRESVAVHVFRLPGYRHSKDLYLFRFAALIQ